MILKSYEITNINLHKNNLVLFYGKNEGLKNEIKNNLLKIAKNLKINIPNRILLVAEALRKKFTTQ